MASGASPARKASGRRPLDRAMAGDPRAANGGRRAPARDSFMTVARAVPRAVLRRLDVMGRARWWTR
jgi:hypothetical protein